MTIATPLPGHTPTQRLTPNAHFKAHLATKASVETIIGLIHALDRIASNTDALSESDPDGQAILTLVETIRETTLYLANMHEDEFDTAHTPTQRTSPNAHFEAHLATKALVETIIGLSRALHRIARDTDALNESDPDAQAILTLVETISKRTRWLADMHEDEFETARAGDSK